MHGMVQVSNTSNGASKGCLTGKPRGSVPTRDGGHHGRRRRQGVGSGLRQGQNASPRDTGRGGRDCVDGQASGKLACWPIRCHEQLGV